VKNPLFWALASILTVTLSNAAEKTADLPEADGDATVEVEAPRIDPKPKSAKKEDGLDSKTRLALRTISERYAKLGDWSAEFAHESANVGLGKGRFYFVRPGKFRYTLLEPEASDFICDGKQAWLVRYPEGRGKPARVQHFKDVSKIELDRYLLVLKGIDALSADKEKALLREFKVSAQVNDENIVLSLEPLRASEIARLDLTFPQTKIAPSKVVILDALGNTTTLNLLKTSAIKKTLPAWFAPDYPKDSKVETF